VKSSSFAVGFYERLGFARDGPDERSGGVFSVPMRLRWRAAQQGAAADGRARGPTGSW
jgi:hypothetical protein